MRKNRKCWAFSAGPYGFRVRVFQYPNSLIYGEYKDPRTGKYVTRSLGHTDRGRAMKWAVEQSAKWVAGVADLSDQTPTLDRIFSLYLQHRTPSKVASEQTADRRRARCWGTWLGQKKDLSKITLHEWETFINARRSGAIDADGQNVEADHRKPVRDGTIWADCVFLLSVLNWAKGWREGEAYLLKENVCRGFALPREKNVRRPVVSAARFAAIRAVAHLVMMRVGSGENRREEPSYLPELLDVAWGTGRRISAILSLRYSDLRLGDGPHGSICWPSDTDKMKKEWSAPINERVRAAINRVRLDRQLKGSPFLFPHPADDSKPLTKELASAWLRRAEDLAGLEHLPGGGWHPFRRGWATSRKHLPDADVAAAGGWSDLTSLKVSYQQPDIETLRAVVAEPPRLRDVGS